jgi:hypothetical protein
MRGERVEYSLYCVYKLPHFVRCKQAKTTPTTPSGRHSFIGCTGGPRLSSTDVIGDPFDITLAPMSRDSPAHELRSDDLQSETPTFGGSLFDRCGNGPPSSATSDPAVNGSHLPPLGVCWLDANWAIERRPDILDLSLWNNSQRPCLVYTTRLWVGQADTRQCLRVINYEQYR